MLPTKTKWSAVTLLTVAALAALTSESLRSAPVVGEWRAYNGDYKSTRYSPLDQINKDTVKKLGVVWRQSLTPDAVRESHGVVPPPPTNNETTPLMVGGLVYFSTGIGGVAALNAATGEVVWHVDTSISPQNGATASPNAGASARDDDGGLVGGATRSLAYWTDGRDERIIALISSRYLVALNAKTGKRYSDFGDNGEVDLRKGQERGATTFFVAHRANRYCSRRHRRWLEYQRH